MNTVDNSAFPKGLDPAATIQSFDAAWNAHDVERVLQFFTDNATVRFMYPPPFPEPDTYTGKAEIRRLLEGYLSGDFHTESFDHRTSLNEITWGYRASWQRLIDLGVQEVEGWAGAAFEGGKIEHFTMSFSPESTAQIEAGLSRLGVAGPISEGLAGSTIEPDEADTEGNGEHGRPHRGPTWSPVGQADHQPPPPQQEHREG